MALQLTGLLKIFIGLTVEPMLSEFVEQMDVFGELFYHIPIIWTNLVVLLSIQAEGTFFFTSHYAT